MRNNYYYLSVFYQLIEVYIFLLILTENLFNAIIFDMKSQLLLCWILYLSFIYLRVKKYL